MKLTHYLFIILAIALTSCSLFVPRRSSFEQLERGTEINEVRDRFGKPHFDSAKSIYQNSNAPVVEKDELNSRTLTYKYCTTPLAKDILFGWFTFWIYAWNCDNSSNLIELNFEENKLVSFNDDLPENKRRAEIREESKMTAEEAQALNTVFKAMAPPPPQATPTPKAKSVECSTENYFGTIKTRCEEN